MGQAASDPIGSARQLKDQDLLALWQSQIGPNGTIADHVAKARDQDGRSALHIAASEGMLNSSLPCLPFDFIFNSIRTHLTPQIPCSDVVDLVS